MSVLPFVKLAFSHSFIDLVFVYGLSFNLFLKLPSLNNLLYSLLGVWPEGSDGTDINALVRSHNRKVIAVADDFCKVHLFQYPCSKPKVSLDQSSLCAGLHCMKLSLPATCFQLDCLEPGSQTAHFYLRTVLETKAWFSPLSLYIK